MPALIRAATRSDLPRMVPLLVEDARRRRRGDPALWAIAEDAAQQIEAAVLVALEGENQPFRQKWLVAERDDALLGLAHSMLLPVPPIYAGKWGDPGLLLPDSVMSDATPPGVTDALLEAAEADLREAGAQLLLASHVPGDDGRERYAGRGYEPLTLYFSKTGLDGAAASGAARPATADDVAGIVERSAENRSILADLDPFWTPHADADARFGRWMAHSLTLTDRDMLVSGPSGSVEGYAIAQPASRLHFPPAHAIEATGVIDDFFHADFADPSGLRNGGAAAGALLRAAEAAFVRRGVETAFVVCPAAWASKIALLEQAGYATAQVWMRKC